MKCISLILALFVLIVARSSASVGVPGGWTANYNAALEQAKIEHKKVLLDFTGSDWCYWCKKIDEEVFETAKFKEYASRHFVLVKVDFPQFIPQSDEVKAQNEKLQSQFQVDGFPTLMIVDAKGKKIWEHSGYIPGGPEGFIRALASK